MGRSNGTFAAAPNVSRAWRTPSFPNTGQAFYPGTVPGKGTIILLEQIPPTLLLALEPYRSACDIIAGHSWRNEPLPAGDGHPVLVYPGLGFSGSATIELRTRLLQIGYQVYDWELGVSVLPSTASFDTWINLMGGQLQRVERAHRRAVSLIGWSLGGLYAREIAKLFPDQVRQVITLGTPRAGPLQPVDFARSTSLSDEGSAERSLMTRLRTKPPVPCSSIYSRTDGLVDWKECIDPELPGAHNIEIEGVSHLGMVHHPDVLRAVAKLLAEPHSSLS